MMGLPYGEEIMIVGRAMSTSVTDRRTDRQTDRITITKTVQRIASHGKNRLDYMRLVGYFTTEWNNEIIYSGGIPENNSLVTKPCS